MYTLNNNWKIAKKIVGKQLKNSRTYFCRKTETSLEIRWKTVEKEVEIVLNQKNTRKIA